MEVLRSHDPSLTTLRGLVAGSRRIVFGEALSVRPLGDGAFHLVTLEAEKALAGPFDGGAVTAVAGFGPPVNEGLRGLFFLFSIGDFPVFESEGDRAVPDLCLPAGADGVLDEAASDFEAACGRVHALLDLRAAEVRLSLDGLRSEVRRLREDAAQDLLDFDDLERLLPADGVERLCEALSDRRLSEVARVTLIRVLAGLERARGLLPDRLRELLAEAAEDAVLDQALATLGQLDAEGSVEVFRGLLGHPLANVRIQASIGLASAATPAALDALLEVAGASGQDPEVAMNASNLYRAALTARGA